MATMTITITVNAKGVTWSRTASIEVDTAQYQQGNTLNTPLFGPEGTPTVIGQHSYAGIAVGFVANKGKGAVAMVQLLGGSTSILAWIPTWTPFLFYHSQSLGGAFNATLTGTDLPDLIAESFITQAIIGSSNTQSLAGLKAIS